MNPASFIPGAVGLVIGGLSIAASADLPSGWLQLGLGGAALGILYSLLKPLIKAMLEHLKRVGTTMEDIAKGQAVTLEISRNILTHAEKSAEREAAAAEAMRALATTLGASPRS